LWIVGTALFVLAVALISYSEIKKQFDAVGAVASFVPSSLETTSTIISLCPLPERGGQSGIKGKRDG
jgi:hypothetical protein